MDEIIINKLIDYAKSFHPKDAVDISEGLDILNLALEGFRENINLSLTQLLTEKNYTKVRDATDLSEVIAEIQSFVDGYSTSLYVSLDSDEEIKEEENILEVEKTILNYSDYAIDSSIPHSLYEDFTHKKAKALSFHGKR